MLHYYLPSFALDSLYLPKTLSRNYNVQLSNLQDNGGSDWSPQQLWIMSDDVFIDYWIPYLSEDKSSESEITGAKGKNTNIFF